VICAAKLLEVQASTKRTAHLPSCRQLHEVGKKRDFLGFFIISSDGFFEKPSLKMIKKSKKNHVF
jgi:hypothetical protein